MDGTSDPSNLNDRVSKNVQPISKEESKKDETNQRYSISSTEPNSSSTPSTPQNRRNNNFYTLNISKRAPTSHRQYLFSHHPLTQRPPLANSDQLPVPTPPERTTGSVRLSTARLTHGMVPSESPVITSGGWRVAKQTLLSQGGVAYSDSPPRSLYSISPKKVLTASPETTTEKTRGEVSNKPLSTDLYHPVPFNGRNAPVNERRRSTRKPYSLDGIPHPIALLNEVEPSSSTAHPTGSPMTSCSLSTNSRNTQSGPASVDHAEQSPLLRRETVFRNDSARSTGVPWEKEDSGENGNRYHTVDFLVYNLGSPEKCGSPDMRMCSPTIPVKEEIRTPWIGNLRMIHAVIPFDPTDKLKDGELRQESLETFAVQQTGSFCTESPRASLRGFGVSSIVHSSVVPHGSMTSVSRSGMLQQPYRSSTSKASHNIKKMEDCSIGHPGQSRLDNEVPSQQRVISNSVSPPSPPPLCSHPIPSSSLTGKPFSQGFHDDAAELHHITARYTQIPCYQESREVWVDESEVCESGCSTPSMLRTSMAPPPPPPQQILLSSSPYDEVVRYGVSPQMSQLGDMEMVSISAENISVVPSTLLSNNPMTSYTQLSPSRSFPVQTVSSMELNSSPRPFAGLANMKKLEGSPFATISHFRIDESTGQYSNVIQTGVIVGGISPSTEDCPESVASPLQPQSTAFHFGSHPVNGKGVSENPSSPTSPHQAVSHLIFPTLLPQLSVVYETPCMTANNTFSGYSGAPPTPPASSEVSLSNTPQKGGSVSLPPPLRPTHPSIPNAPPLHKGTAHYRSNSLLQRSHSGDFTALDTSSHSTFNEALRASQNQYLEKGIAVPHQQLIVNPNELALVQMCDSDSTLSSSHNQHVVRLNSDSSATSGSGSEQAALRRLQRHEKDKELVSSRCAIPLEERPVVSNSGLQGEDHPHDEAEGLGSFGKATSHGENTISTLPPTSRAPNPPAHQRNENLGPAVTLRERVVSLLISTPPVQQGSDTYSRIPTEAFQEDHLPNPPSPHSNTGDVTMASVPPNPSDLAPAPPISVSGLWHSRMANRDDNARRVSNDIEEPKPSPVGASGGVASRGPGRTSFSFFSTDTVDGRTQLTATALRTIKPLFMLPPHTSSLRSCPTPSPSFHSSSKVSPRTLSSQGNPGELKGQKSRDESTMDGENTSDLATATVSTPTATTMETNNTLVSTLRSVVSGTEAAINTVTVEHPPAGITVPVSYYSYTTVSLPSGSSASGGTSRSIEENSSQPRAMEGVMLFSPSSVAESIAVQSDTDTSSGAIGNKVSQAALASPIGHRSLIASPNCRSPQHRVTHTSNVYSPLHHRVYKVSSEFWNRVDSNTISSPPSKAEVVRISGETQDQVVKGKEVLPPSVGVMSARGLKAQHADSHKDDVNISKDEARSPMGIAAFKSRDRSEQFSSRSSSEASNRQQTSPPHTEGSPLVPQDSGDVVSFPIPWPGSPSAASGTGLSPPPGGVAVGGVASGSFSLQSDATRVSASSSQQHPHTASVVVASTQSTSAERTAHISGLPSDHPGRLEKVESISDAEARTSAHKKMISMYSNMNSPSQSFQATVGSGILERAGQNTFITSNVIAARNLHSSLETPSNRSIEAVTPPFPTAVTLTQNRQAEVTSLSSPMKAGHLSPLPPSKQQQQQQGGIHTTAIPPPPPPASRFSPSPTGILPRSSEGESVSVVHSGKNMDGSEDVGVQNGSVSPLLHEDVSESKEKQSFAVGGDVVCTASPCDQSESGAGKKTREKRSKKIKRKKKTSTVSEGGGFGPFHLPNYLVRTSSSGRLGKGFGGIHTAGPTRVSSASRDHSHPLFKRQSSNEDTPAETGVVSGVFFSHHHHAVQQHPSHKSRSVTRAHTPSSNVSSPVPSRRPYSPTSIFSSRELNIARLGYRASTPTPTNSIHEDHTRASVGNTSSLNCPIVNILQQDSFSLMSQDALLPPGGIRTHTQTVDTTSANVYAAFGAVTRLCSDPDAPRAIKQRRQTQPQQPSVQQLCSARQILPDGVLPAPPQVSSGPAVSEDHPLPLPPSGFFSGTISLKMYSQTSTSSEEVSNEEPKLLNGSKLDRFSHQAELQDNRRSVPLKAEGMPRCRFAHMPRVTSSQVLVTSSLDANELHRDERNEVVVVSCNGMETKPVEIEVPHNQKSSEGEDETTARDPPPKSNLSTEVLWPLQLTLAGRVSSKAGPGVYRPTAIGSFSLVSHQSSGGNNMLSPFPTSHQYYNTSMTSSTSGDSSTANSSFQQHRPVLQRQESVLDAWRKNMRDKHNVSRLANSPPSMLSSPNRFDCYSTGTSERTSDAARGYRFSESDATESNTALRLSKENAPLRVFSPSEHKARLSIPQSTEAPAVLDRPTNALVDSQNNINEATVKAGCVKERLVVVGSSSGTSSNSSGSSSSHDNTETASLYVQKTLEMDLPTLAAVAPLPYELVDEEESNTNTNGSSKESTLPNTASGCSAETRVGQGSLVLLLPRAESIGNSRHTHPSSQKTDSVTWGGESAIPTQPPQYSSTPSFTSPYLPPAALINEVQGDESSQVEDSAILHTLSAVN